MKLSAAVGVGILSLFLGIPAGLYAQDQPKQDESKPDEPKATKPDKDEAKPPKQDTTKPSKEEDDSTRSSRTSQTQGETEKSQTEHSQTASAGKGGRIPDNQFKAHFGRSHTFVVNQTTIVEGQPRFQYSGFWFGLSNPWPAGWAYTDQCYIDYVDGEYILYDLLHPGVTVVLVVVM